MSDFAYNVHDRIEVKEYVMKYEEIGFKEIISKKDLENGNLILLTGRPAVGKTKTCCDLFKYYSKSFNCLYFDMGGEGSTYFFDNQTPKGLIKNYMSSIEIIKKIQYEARHNELKIVFMDFWQLVNDKNEWFIRMMLEMFWYYGVVFVVTSQLARKVEKRKNHLPKQKDLEEIENIGKFAMKKIVIFKPALYSQEEEDGLHYLII